VYRVLEIGEKHEDFALKLEEVLSFTCLPHLSGICIDCCIVCCILVSILYVASYPSAGGRREAHGCIFQERKMRGVVTIVYSRKMLEKPKKCGLRTLSVKGSGVVFTHGEGISTPRVRHKGRQLLTKCVISCLRFVLFSLFYVFMSFLCLLYFLSFCGRQGCFPRSYVSSIAMRKSDLCSSLRTKRWLSCFDLFPQNRF